MKRLTRLNKVVSESVLAIILAVLSGCSTNTPETTPESTLIPPSTQPEETIFSTANPSTTSTPSLTISQTPTPLKPSPWPSTIFTPEMTLYGPEGDRLEVFQCMLDLINLDRQNQGLSSVTLSYNAAAQLHAEDMLKNHYLAHWGTDGQKPYMRYTLSGGLNYEQENSAFSTSSGEIDIKRELQALEDEMMNHDEASNWGHRDNILNTWHKKVNLGIAYDNNTVALVQQFEGNYVEFYSQPAITGNTLILSGRFTESGMILNNISINYDPWPEPIPGTQLNNPKNPYHSYGLDNILGQVIPPPPEGRQYNSLPSNTIVADKGIADESGRFYIEADISSFLQKGRGVYTLALVPSLNKDNRNFTNYSIFVE